MERKTIGIDAHSIGQKQGGNESYILGLLKGLSEISTEEFNFIIFIPKNKKNSFSSIPENFKFVSVSKNPLYRILLDLSLKTFFKKLDLLHTQYHLPLFLKCPGIITFHDTAFLRFPEFFPRKEYIKMNISLSYSVKKARKIITVSEFSKREILNFYKIPEEKVVCIYNGVSENFKYLPEIRKEEIIKKFKIKGKYILFVGNLQPRKNVLRLIRSFNYIKRNKIGKDLNLVIVGKKLWKYKEIFEEFKNSPFKKEIIFTGYVKEEDLVFLYNCAEIFVYPSIYEGFGLPVIEAMACGVPVITSNTSSLPEIVENAGLLINPKKEQEIINAIITLLDNPNLRMMLKEKGLKQAKKFSWKITAEKTLIVYQDVLSINNI